MIHWWACVIVAASVYPMAFIHGARFSSGQWKRKWAEVRAMATGKDTVQ